MLPENPIYFVRGDDGEEYGPVDLAELRDWVQENRAGLGTEVKRDEPQAIWQPWQDFPELVALLAEIDAGGTGPIMPPAPLWRRTLAFGLDIVLISILSTPIFAVLAILFMPDWCRLYVQAATTPPFSPPDIPRSADLVVSLIGDIIMSLYFAVFQARHGQTPAKQLLRLRVVDDSGQKPVFLQAFWRAILLILSMNLFFIPMIYAFFTPERRAVHDLLAGTYVVDE